MKEGELKQHIEDIFERYDRNDDGVLERPEVELMFEHMMEDHKGRGKGGNIKEYVQNYMFEADSN